MHKTRLEGNHKTLTFDVMHLFDSTHPRPLKFSKRIRFQVRNWEVLHKIRLEGGHQTLTFGFMQLVDTMQPGGAMMTSTTTNFSPLASIAEPGLLSEL